MGKGKFTLKVNNMIKLPQYEKSVIIGLLLSDGWLTMSSSKSKNARLGFKQSLFHFAYFWHVFNVLSPYCSSYPHFIRAKRNNVNTFSLEFFTKTLPCFTELYKLFYII